MRLNLAKVEWRYKTIKKKIMFLISVSRIGKLSHTATNFIFMKCRFDSLKKQFVSLTSITILLINCISFGNLNNIF